MQAPWTPSRNLKFICDRSLFSISVAMRVLSIWNARTIRSSISFMWSGTFCGSSSAGRGMFGLRERRPPAFEAAVFRGARRCASRCRGSIRDTRRASGGRRVLICRLQVAGVGEHLVEDAAVELAAVAVADEQVEGARGIDLLGRRLGVAGPRDARAVDHREAVFEAELVRLDAEDEARDGGLAADAAAARTWSIVVPTRISF